MSPYCPVRFSPIFGLLALGRCDWTDWQGNQHRRSWMAPAHIASGAYKQIVRFEQ